MNADQSVLGLLHRAYSLDHILRTNNPPSDHEIDHMRHLLRDIEPCIDAVNQEHPSDHSKAHQLEALSNACRSSLSSLRQLPTEIISHIFSQAASPENGVWNTLDLSNEPWTLTYVSSSWRTIALAHQGLWSFITTNLETLNAEGKPEPALAVLVCALQRSGKHALSIDFTDNYPTSRVKELLLALLPHSPRWLDVKFSMSFQHLELLSQVRERLPLLRSLDVYAYGANTFGVLHAFEVAPRLREASVGVGDPHTLVLPWSQLTKFQGSLVPSLNLLHDVSQVVDCSLTFSPWYFVDSSPSIFQHQNIQHHMMHKLQINSEYALDGLIAPALEVLHIFSHQGSSKLHHVTSFLHRSSCFLQSLLLSDITIECERDLLPLMEAAPSLTFFQVRFGVVNWDALLRLLVITETQCLLPNLKTLRLIFGNEPRLNAELYADASLLLNMLESRFHVTRREGLNRLESIALLQQPHPLPSEYKTRLAKLQHLGLDVVDDTRPESSIPPVVLWAWRAK